MSVKHFMMGVLLTTGLLVSACGGTEPEAPGSEAAVGSREDAIIYPCDGSSQWTYTYYSDSTKTTQVGDSRCDCDGSGRQWGQKTSYFTFTRVQCTGPF